MTVRISILILICCTLLTGVAHAATNKSAAVKGAVWLSKGKPAGEGQGADTAIALRAANRLSSAEATRRAAAIRASADKYSTTAGATAKTILGLVATGIGNPRCAGNVDLLDRLTSFGASGRYGRTAWDQALGMIALRSLGTKPSGLAAGVLLSSRGKGGWNFTLSKTARDDVTHTALAIIALRAAGVKASDPGLKAGLAWMLKQRTRAGGFAHERKDRNEANATALAVEALRSLGKRDSGGLKALRALQRPDGAFQFTATDAGSRGLASADAVVALSGRHMPVASRSKLPQHCA